MEQIIRIGMDTSEHVFQLHGVNAAEVLVLRKKLRRKEMVAFFEKLPPTVIAIEACGASHHWARLLQSFGHTATCGGTLREGTTLILDDLDLRSSDEIEEEADKFAEDALIPHDLLDRCSSDRPITSDIVDIAMEAGIHPAIVAGRWQRKHNEYRRFAKMLGHGEVSTHLQ